METHALVGLVILSLFGFWVLQKTIWTLIKLAVGLTAFVYIGVLILGFVLFIVIPITCGVLGLEYQHVLKQLLMLH